MTRMQIIAMNAIWPRKYRLILPWVRVITHPWVMDNNSMKNHKYTTYGSAHQFYAAIELTRRLKKLDVVCIFFSCSFHIKSYIRKLVRS